MLPFLNIRQMKSKSRVFKNHIYKPETTSNTLEAVVIQTTSYEIKKGEFRRFVTLLASVTEPTEIDCVISVNNDNHISIDAEVRYPKDHF
jgi:hypothetical protein